MTSRLLPLAFLLLPFAAYPSPDCEWCGMQDAPDDPDASITIAGPDEPGERLILEGTVFQPDGVTPAPDVLVYLYHTNAKGRYPRRGDETGNGKRHGYLRGWLRTGADGTYRVDTIRPGAYPLRRDPAHIHMTIQPPGAEEYWIDSIHFAGDPRLDAEEQASAIELVRDEEGHWHGTRDIILRP